MAPKVMLSDGNSKVTNIHYKSQHQIILYMLKLNFSFNWSLTVQNNLTLLQGQFCNIDQSFGPRPLQCREFFIRTQLCKNKGETRALFQQKYERNTGEISIFKKNTSAFIDSENWFLAVAGQLIALTGRHVLVS